MGAQVDVMEVFGRHLCQQPGTGAGLKGPA